MGLEIPRETMVAAATAAGDAPGFEGFEKRLEVEFFRSSHNDRVGLRALSREDLDRILTAAECTVVSQLSNEHFDSYVLSESSLFVYPLKMILKTCGTTKLLRSIPVLLELASSLKLSVRSCKYRRGTFFYPSLQPYPHGSFEEETEFLGFYFGNLGLSKAYVLGTGRFSWHVYVATVTDSGRLLAPAGGGVGAYTLEVCMTGLDRVAASRFYKSAQAPAGRSMGEVAGISRLLPGADLCEYAFDPCGYSMNGVDAATYSTIHVTPEVECSYASFEAGGADVEGRDLPALLQRVVDCFRPAWFTAALYATSAAAGDTLSSWRGTPGCPAGYGCVSSARQEGMPGGDAVVFHTFCQAGMGAGGELVVPVPLAIMSQQEEEYYQHLPAHHHHHHHHHQEENQEYNMMMIKKLFTNLSCRVSA